MFYNCFYGIIKMVCCAFCVTIVGASGVYAGDDMAEGSVSFFYTGGSDKLEVRNIFDIDAVQLDRVNAITLVNQEPDDQFTWFWDIFFRSRNLDSLSFIGCSFLGWSTLDMLYDSSITSLTVSNCGLVAEQANEILRYAYSGRTRNIDLSDNLLGQNGQLFRKGLSGVYLETLNISGNNFDQEVIDGITSDNKAYKSIGQIIF
ncbi:MAG: hypothetical protein LBJ89_03060 [Holosporales bacterium]|nr:hypothetical protein [Holosporales bacterium]